jgi:serine/threonine protein kinase
MPSSSAHSAFAQSAASASAGSDARARASQRSEREALAEALADHYEIVYLIGRGGMGAVYLARCRVLERLVAIKVLSPELGASAESRERFRREARTAARLMHPGIVPLYTFGEANGFMYIVMGFVRGESLAARLRREPKLSVEDTRRVLVELSAILEYSHRQGVVHRDLKPDNILIDRESGRLMLTDFGIAKLRTLEPSPRGEEPVGTPQYMSPEQALGDCEIDGRSDLYALGVLGYALLAGRPPFEGASLRELVYQHVMERPQPLRDLAPHVPNDLAEVITRCLEKHPAERYRDARDLHEALQAVRPARRAWWNAAAAMAALFI